MSAQQPIQIFNQPPRSPQQPQTPRSLLTPTPGAFDWLTPPSVPTAAARLLVSVGGGIITGAIGRVIPWGPEAIALALTLALALTIALGFLWRVDRRGAWVLVSYFCFGAIGCALAVGFGGEV
jgi:hypothetical protein